VVGSKMSREVKRSMIEEKRIRVKTGEGRESSSWFVSCWFLVLGFENLITLITN